MNQFQLSDEQFKELLTMFAKMNIDVNRNISQQQKEKIKQSIDNSKTWLDLIEYARKIQRRDYGSN